jgi:excinuclease ABC subunit A
MEDDDGMIRVRDARVHNLRGVDVDLPRDRLVVLTGVSGSGKSSLAFDTVFAESQRRFLESIAPYARRLLHQAGAPRVGSIEGLPPAVALQQHRSVPGSRSSVGTITTCSNVLRMLLSRAGTYPAGAARLDSDSFSPNTAAGACPTCHGAGVRYEVTERSLVPDPSLSIRERAVAAWPGAWQGKNQRDILAVLGHDVDAPWRELPQEARDWILFTDDQPVVVVDPVREVGRTQRPYKGQFMSARRYVMKALTMSQSASQRRRALEFVETLPCEACGGTRLTPAALSVTFAGRTIVGLAALPIRELAGELRPFADPERVDEDPAAALCTDLVDRLDAIDELGLGYLSLDRPAPTLSAGELQRLRIAAQLRSGLFGVVYVLDEPSAGLHPRDVDALVTLLERLRAGGNSLLVVEHHVDVARRADWVVDVGPGAGIHGGRIVYSGPPGGLATAPGSATAPFLAASSPRTREPREPAGWIELDDVHLHNLHGVDLRVPVGCLTAVTGVSGSGKSSLVDGALAAAVARQLGSDLASVLADPAAEAPEDDDDAPAGVRAGVEAARWSGARGLHLVDRLVRVDQRPIGRSRRSNVATYTGLFDAVRKLFAATDAARGRGWKAGRFSFNVDGGRCEACQGEGAVAVELMFLPGTYAVCEACGGSRYAPGTLEVTWRGMTIADVLALTVDDALAAFEGEEPVLRTVRALRDVGLGYLALGQGAMELSGGEAQRIKLASELQRARRGSVLYLLDEPTTGLHPADVELLAALLHRLADAGHTVVVVEHDMALAAGADHVVDLGPGGGDEGGRIVVAGTPAEVAACEASATAAYLRERLPK